MKLFEPGKIGKLTLKNRIVMAPMLALVNDPIEGGRVTQRFLDFYIAQAKGGVGMIITSFMNPSENWEPSFGEPILDSWKSIAWLNDMVTAVHDYGTKLCVQLSAGFGRNLIFNPELPHAQPVCASAVPCHADPNTICRPLTKEDIQTIIRDYETSVKIITLTGADAIEMHAHAGYIMDQFLTPIWNTRTDEYGGDLKNRFRFTAELIAAIKRAAGDDFPISYRYALTHCFPEGRGVEEGLEIARMLEAAGVHALHIDAGSYETMHWSQPTTTMEPGCLVYLAEMVKKVVNIPVITVGKLGDPRLAEETLQKGKADFVALGRPLLADPDWPKKAKEGRLEDINPCVACHDGCLKRVMGGLDVRCTVNPTSTREAELALTPAETKKDVLVIGGGPAGLEAARVSAKRGHKVTLLEKNWYLGGNLFTSAIPDFKQDYKRLLEYLITQVYKAGVTVRLGHEATPDLIQKLNTDVVFVATGAESIIPDYPGMKKAIEAGRAITAVNLLLGKGKADDPVVIIGGGLVGCETALWLAEQGRKVTVVARHDTLREMFWINRLDIYEKLDAADAVIMRYTNVIEITDDGVIVADKQGDKKTLDAETIVLAVRLEPDRGLLDALEGTVPEIYAIGDCVDSRLVSDAINEGYRLARLV